MFRTYAYRLYPTKSQQARLESVRETCRRFYNDCLAERKEAYERERRSITQFEQAKRVKEFRATNPFAKDVYSHILQVVVADLEKAFRAFFRRVKSGEKPGYPRFKSQKRFHGFGFKEYGNGGIRIDGRRLRIFRIGRIAVRWHRQIEGKIKTSRIYEKAGKWFVSFVCEVEKPEPLPKTGHAIGVDVGLHRLVTLSNGEGVENPRWYRQAQRRLRVVQRSMQRKRLGGSNRRKIVRILQRLHLKVTRTRKDFLNKLADDLTERFDRVILEDLRVTEMVRGHFAKSILDAGWGYLVKRLTDKAESAGREVILVNPAYTSKTCSGCGFIFENLTLRDRWISCGCGVSLDRDHNAAINILKRGLGQSPWAPISPPGGLAQEAVRH